MTDNELDNLKSQIQLEKDKRKSEIITKIEKDNKTKEIKQELKEINKLLKRQYKYSISIICPVQYDLEDSIVFAKIDHQRGYDKLEDKIINGQAVQAEVKMIQKKWNDVVKKIDNLALKYKIDVWEIWEKVDNYNFH